MKAPFRFFRGELNGYYIRNFLLSRNNAIDEILAELVYHALVSWNLPGSEGAGELPIRKEDLEGIAKFAGVVRPVQYYENTLGSIRLTSSEAVGGVQYSERGLFDMSTELFDFVRTDDGVYATDIAVEASPTKKMSLVPHGTVPLGYVAYGTDLFDSDGNIIPGNLLSSPPSGGVPYDPYYGPNFLTLENSFTSSSSMSDEMFMLYYECVMRIRQNGASIAELLYLTDLLCSGYVYDLEVVPYTYYYQLYYSLNTGMDLDNKGGRLATWLRIIEKRFPDFTVVER
jgi:hypothetical protein